MGKARHFLLRTDDIQWAVCVAGALFNADEGHQLTLESDLEELQFMAKSLSPASRDMEEIRLPQTAEDYRALDVLTAKKTQIEIDLIMGMVVDQAVEVREVPIDTLSASLLFRDHGIVTKPAYYFPKPSRKTLEEYSKSGVSLLLCNDQYKDVSIRFWEEIGGTGGFRSISNDSVLEQIMWMASLKNPRTVISTDVDNKLMYVLRAWYKDYNTLNSVPVILSFVPTDRSALNPRTTLVWPQNVPSPSDVQVEDIAHKGRWWAEQIESRFDPTVFHKRRAGVM